EPLTCHVAGLDLGKRTDPSALALLRFRVPSAFPRHYEVPTLYRWQMGTSYTDIARDLVKFAGQLDAGKAPFVLVVDATGVGNAVCEIIHRELALARMPGGMVRVTITAGSAVTQTGSGEWNVAKKQLASILQALVCQRRLQVAPQPEAETLLAELENFTVK